MEDKGHSLLVKIAKKLKALNPLQKTIEKWQVSRALRIKREASLRGPHPMGYWRCTHVSEEFSNKFTVGCIYEARELFPGSSNVRIIPQNHTGWSPFWSPIEKKFCYTNKEMMFEYIGSYLPLHETCSSSEA